jgi:hypothetical protein
MGHNITAIVLKGSYNKDIAKEYDLIGKDLGFNLTLFHFNHYYSAYWQFILKCKGYLQIPKTDYMIFPTDIVLSQLMEKISDNEEVDFAIISTDYFGGMGQQFASVFKDQNLVSDSLTTINKALNFFGVERQGNLDEFDTVGLDKIRSQPDFLEKYYDLADEHNL